MLTPRILEDRSPVDVQCNFKSHCRLSLSILSSNQGDRKGGTFRYGDLVGSHQLQRKRCLESESPARCLQHAHREQAWNEGTQRATCSHQQRKTRGRTVVNARQTKMWCYGRRCTHGQRGVDRHYKAALPACGWRIVSSSRDGQLCVPGEFESMPDCLRIS